jgi:hypothetical protein
LLAYLRSLRQNPDDELLLPLNELFGASGPGYLEVLELGSGCGIVGIGFAQLYHNCHVLLTDLPEAMEILDCNIAQARPASGSKLSKATMNWDDGLPVAVAQGRYHLFLVSDCTYNSDSIPALVKTLHALNQKSPWASIVVSMKFRHSSENVFFDMMNDAGFRVASEVKFPLPDRHRTAVGQELENVEIHIFRNTISLENIPSRSQNAHTSKQAEKTRKIPSS